MYRSTKCYRLPLDPVGPLPAEYPVLKRWGLAHLYVGFQKTQLDHNRVIYVRTDKGWVKEFCCGERFASISAGFHFNKEVYRGSYSDNWHGGPTGNLTELINWVADADYPEYEYKLWFINDKAF